MLRDKFNQCVGCYFDPCRCFGKESQDECSHCAMLRDEVAALRREVNRYRAMAELEKDRRYLLEKEMLSTRRVSPPPFRGGSA